MDIIDLGLNLQTNRAEQQLRRLDSLANSLFNKRGYKINVSTSGLPLGRITGDFDNFRKSLDAATARVTAFTATTGIVYGLADAFRRLFTESIKLEKQLASIQAILRVSGSDLTRLSNDLLQVANSTSQSFDVAVEAAVEFSRQGLTMNKTIEATNAALALSRIAGLDAASAVQSLTATINTFTQEGLTYQKVLDTITSLDNNFAASAAGIADGLKRVGSVASEAGIQLKEIASLITVVQQVSARGEAVISNGLKTIITRLNRGSVQEALAQIGIQTQTASGEFRSMIDILTDLANKQDELSDSQKAFINETVAGVYQINTLQSTLKALGGEYSLFDKAIQIAGNSAGDTAARLRVLNDTTASSLQVLKNNLSRTFADIGSQTVLPILKDFADVSNLLLKSINTKDFEKLAGQIDTRSVGEKIGEGLIDGISSFLGSSGKFILLGVVGKILLQVTKDIGKSLISLSGINQGLLVNKDLQNTVNQAIATGNQYLVNRLATTDSLIVKNQILNRLLETQNSIGNLNLTNVLVSRGLAKNNIKTKASGFIPAILKEKKDIQNGVGGASKSAIPLIRNVNLGKGRERVVVNSDEVLVEDYLKSGKDAIFNQDMIRQAGGIEALKKLGKVKSFARGFKDIEAEYNKRKDAFVRAGGTAQAFASTEIGARLNKQLTEAFAKERGRISGNPLSGTSIAKSASRPVNPLGGGATGISSGAGFPVGKVNPVTVPGSNPLGNASPSVVKGIDDMSKNLKSYQTLERIRRQSITSTVRDIKVRQERTFVLRQEAIAERKALEQAKKDASSAKRNKIALTAAIAAPIVSGAVSGAIGNDSPGAKTANNAVGALSSGVAIAALTNFNPLGVAVAAVVTGMSFLKKEAEDAVPSFEALRKSADRIIAKNQEQLNAIQNVVQAQNSLAELNKSGAPVKERAKVRQDIVDNISAIKDAGVQRVLLSGDTSKNAQEKIQQFQSGLQESSRIQESLLVSRKLSEAAGLKKSNFFGSKDTSINPEDFSAIIGSTIDSIDLTSISSERLSIAMKRLSENAINGEDFFRNFGTQLGLTEESASGLANEFRNLTNTMNADSKQALDRFIVSQINYKKTLQDLSKVITEAETVSIGFRKAFNTSINNMLNKFSFKTFEQGLKANASIDIAKSTNDTNRELGRISEIDSVINSANLNRSELAADFTAKSNDILLNGLKPVLDQIKTVSSPEKQAEILRKVGGLFRGENTFSDLESTVANLVGTSEDSENLLKLIKDSSKDVGGQIAKLRVENEVGLGKIAEIEKLQLIKLQRGPQSPDILSGETDKARSKLLNKVVDADLTKQISDISKKIAIVGSTTRQGRELISQRDNLTRRQATLRQQDLEARRFLLPVTNPKLLDSSAKQEADLVKSDFFKTQGQLLKNGLEEINTLNNKKFGGNKFSQDSINKVSTVLSSGDIQSTIKFLDEQLAKTFNQSFRDLIENLKKSIVQFPQQEAIQSNIVLPAAPNLSSEEKVFRESLNKTIDPNILDRARPALEAISNAEKRTKEAADAVAVVAAQIKDVETIKEGNRQIIAQNRSGFEGRLGTATVKGLEDGTFTREKFTFLLSDFQRQVINNAGFKFPEKGNLDQVLKDRQKDLETRKSEQDAIQKQSNEALIELKKATEDLGVIIKDSSQNQQASLTKIEQAVSIAVDVRGVDNKLVTDMKTALTSVVDNRIKEVIKDTFNKDVVTKPKAQPV